MKGFTRKTWRGDVINLPFVVTSEVWTLWVNDQRDIKLKITKWLPLNHGEHVHEGYIDSYGWLCYSVHTQFVCVPRERYEVRILPVKMSLQDYKKIKRRFH